MAVTRSVVRKYVPLTEDDLKDLRRIRMDGSDEAVALHALTGDVFTEHTSEASALHALVEAGRQALAAKKEEIGHAKLAQFIATDEESKRWRESRRARSARRHTGENA